MDPELPEALDILALIEEQLDVISVDPEIVSSAGDFRRDSTSSVESLTQVGRQLRAASADWANRTGRMASMDPARMVTSAQQFAAAGRTEEAINVLTGISERSPEHVEAWDALESLHASTGQYEELLAMRREWVENAGGDAESVDRLEERLRTDGAAGYWEWRLEVLQERESEGEDISPVYMATAQAALGNTEEALVSLREAASTRDRRLLTSLRTDPVWDSMRSDPRFASLMRQIRNEVSGRGAGRGGRGGRGGGGGGGGAGGRGPN
jgi:tetratricopeptide (TPR) repeat protein